jgi:serine/threonine protein kinase
MMEIFLDEVNKSIEGEFDIYFKFIEKIGKGAFGTVIRAFYYELEREVAVKVIDKTKHKFKHINRLKFEINILKQIKHKNIVEFLGCIETNSKMYIITEFLKDGTLKDLIDIRQKEGINYFIFYF